MAPIIAFDLYGTILSTDSIAVELAEIVGDDRVAKDLAALWRRYQLEYTWRINCMGKYMFQHTTAPRTPINIITLGGVFLLPSFYPFLSFSPPKSSHLHSHFALPIPFIPTTKIK